MGQCIGPKGWLRWSAHPLVGAVCRDFCPVPCFSPSTSEVAVGFWPFCTLFFLFHGLRPYNAVSGDFCAQCHILIFVSGWIFEAREGDSQDFTETKMSLKSKSPN